jgi:acetyl-CoA carboxylase biotin carboxyl carrier protein
MDEKLLFTLIERFETGSLTSLTYRDGDQKLTLRKGGVPAAPVQREPVKAAASPQAAPAPVEPAPPAETQGVEVITSPIVATFYASNMPDAPPFVKAGDTVKKGQTLCILEAMKMMNKLDAEADCEILAVKALSGALVEFGQPLFEIRKL